MIKKENGITLISLAFTVIIMVILTGVALTYNYEGVNKVRSNNLEIELGVVRQAVLEQYEKARAVGIIGSNSENEEFWVGEKISSMNLIELPDGFNLSMTVDTYDTMYPEKCYYRIYSTENAADNDKLGYLKKLGLENLKNDYIVNYQTGEVYNDTIKDPALYLGPITREEKKEDTESFNDWKE